MKQPTDRHAFRAQWHDYNGGIYFITICSAGKAHFFGHISNGEMQLSELGQIVDNSILDLQNHHNVEIWNHIVMPNHVHMVINVGTRPAASASAMASTTKLGCLRPPMHGEACADYHHNSSLAVIVGGLKSAVTRKYRLLLRTRQAASLPDETKLPPIWQQRFHEHIVRNQRTFDNIMQYIDNNVINWGKDCFFN